MLKNVRKKINEKKKKKGFTLIELIIVIAIIAILAAVALPRFGQVRENANHKADLSVAKNIHTIATSVFQNDPTDITGIVGTPETAKDNATLGPLMEKWETGKTAGHTGEFLIGMDTEGNVHVYLGSEEVYPNTNAVFE
jgi:type IV pilus assembly protein PilA